MVSSTLDLLRRFEGFRSEPYPDVTRLRLGYGSDTITRPDGSFTHVQKGMTVGREDAERDLARRVAHLEAENVATLGDSWTKLDEPTRSALTSVAYNYGSLPDRLLPAIRSGDKAQIASAVQGLRGDNKGVNADRRDQEAEVILGKSLPPARMGNSYTSPTDSNVQTAGTAVKDFESKWGIPEVESLPPTSSAEAFDKRWGESAAPPTAPVEITPIKPLGVGSHWGEAQDLSNNVLLGGGVPITAETSALKNYLFNPTGNEPYSAYRDQAYAQTKGAQEEWQKTNPRAAVANAIVGPLPGTLAGMAAGQEYLAAPIAARLGAMAPKLQPAIATAGKFLTGNAGTSIPGKVASRLAAGAIEGGEAGALQSGLTDAPISEDMLAGATFGSILRPLTTPLANALLKPLTARASSGTADLISAGKAAGIEDAAMPQGHQITTSHAVQDAGERLVGRADNDKQIVALTRELGKTVGIKEPKLTPEVLFKREREMGKALDKTVDDIGFTPDSQTWSDAQYIMTEMHSNIDRVNLGSVPKAFEDVLHELSSGAISGVKFRAMTYGDSLLGRLAKDGTPIEKQYAVKIKDMLQQNMLRFAQANGKGGIADKLAEQLKDYKNIKVLEDAVNRSGPSGLIAPQALRTAAEVHYGSNLRLEPNNKMPLLARMAELLPSMEKQGNAEVKSALMEHPVRALYGGAQTPGGHALAAGALTGMYEFAPMLSRMEPGVPWLTGGAMLGTYALNKLKESGWAKMMKTPAYRDWVAGIGPAPELPLRNKLLGTPLRAAMPGYVGATQFDRDRR